MPIETQSRVILLHPNFDRVATNQKDLLNRFNNYGAVLAKVSGGNLPRLELWAGISLDNFPNIELNVYRNLAIFRLGNPSRIGIVFTLRTIFMLRKIRSKNTLLVAGDLGASLITISVAKILFPKLRTQLTFHGALPDGKGLVKKAQAYFQRKLVKFSADRATKIRVVSNHLAHYITREYALDESRIFVSPISVSRAITPQTSLRKFHKVGIVGRLHPERGVDEALDILDYLIEIFPNLSVSVAGNGPEFPKVLNWSQGFGSKPSIQILGNLDAEGVKLLFSEITVLLSCAEREGYGMTIREAALSGVHVVARSNYGTREAKELLGNSLSLYETKAEAKKLLGDILSKSPIPPLGLSNLIEHQLQLDLESEESLAREWWSACSD